jgi:Type II restriction enzyme SfiI
VATREARDIFQTAPATSDSEVIVLAEDLVQYALEVAECYPINKRFAGFIDYKRVRWMSAPFGLFPQVLLVDAKASTENNRDTLQQSQLAMDAEFLSNKGAIVTLPAGVPPHLPIRAQSGTDLLAVTTSAFLHFHYTSLNSAAPPFRTLHAIYVLLLPHQRLKGRYNPNPATTFFGQGKHSPARGEVPRIRVYFNRLRGMCPWRLQELRYADPAGYTTPLWRDTQPEPDGPVEVHLPFEFIGR